MKKLVLLFTLLCSFSVQAHKPAIVLWTSQVIDESLPKLSFDLTERFKMHHIPQGTYRIVANGVPTNKYIKFVFKGAMNMPCADYTCLYLANTEGKYDKISCFDLRKFATRGSDYSLSIDL